MKKLSLQEIELVSGGNYTQGELDSMAGVSLGILVFTVANIATGAFTYAYLDRGPYLVSDAQLGGMVGGVVSAVFASAIIYFAFSREIDSPTN